MKTSYTPFIALFFLAFIFAIPYPASGQTNKSKSGLKTLDESFFVGGLSATILDRGQIEVNANASLFSAWQAVHQSIIESPVVDRLRFTDFTANVEAYYGFSYSGRWDLGIRLRYARSRLDHAARSSPFKVFGSDNADGDCGTNITYQGLRAIGLRFRVMPLVSVPELTITGGYSFASIKSDTVAFFLNADRNNFDLNATYYIPLNENNSSFYYFIANGNAYQPGIDSDHRCLATVSNDTWRFDASGSFFIVQRLGRLMLYPGITYTINFKPPAREGSDKALIKTSEQVLGILGVQYQIGETINVNLSGAIPFLLESSNLQTELVRTSYSFVSLGGRVVF